MNLASSISSICSCAFGIFNVTFKNHHLFKHLVSPEVFYEMFFSQFGFLGQNTNLLLCFSDGSLGFRLPILDMSLRWHVRTKPSGIRAVTQQQLVVVDKNNSCRTLDSRHQVFILQSHNKFRSTLFFVRTFLSFDKIKCFEKCDFQIDKQEK